MNSKQVMTVVVLAAVLTWSTVMTVLGQLAAVGALLPSLGLLIQQITSAFSGTAARSGTAVQSGAAARSDTAERSGTAARSGTAERSGAAATSPADSEESSR
ncbi:hypothetical protein [Streptomyces apricus]|uniref:Uncharacterized protein n=1 Tax=Streptomyces apricus TaxID=1828112 RepID=A0A5B0AAL1_9ACTN|nr:hypothetical protein [Streptomyces apricus]KAA0925615.1 hypothetical protein FGF04_32750 [Streptomyces apricus]